MLRKTFCQIGLFELSKIRRRPARSDLVHVLKGLLLTVDRIDLTVRLHREKPRTRQLSVVRVLLRPVVHGVVGKIRARDEP